jgi:hypothetical protein
MKKLILFFVMLFIAVPMFAQGGATLDISLGGVIKFLGSGILGSAAVLFADASKHFKAGWDWQIFMDTKIRPFLLTNGICIALYFIFGLVPFAQVLVEAWIGEDIGVITAVSLFGAATAIVNGIMKKKE